MLGWKITSDDDLYFDLFPEDDGDFTGCTYDGIRYLGAGESSRIMMSRGVEFSDYTLQVSAGTLTPVAGEEEMYRLTMLSTGLDVHISVAGDLTLTLTFGDTVSELQAGVPYIIRWASGNDIVNPVFTGVTINNTLREVECILDGGYEVAFCGNYDTKTFTDEDRSALYLGENNTLYYPQNGIFISGLRACFKLFGITAGDLASGGRSIVLDFADKDSTGITSAENQYNNDKTGA